MPPRWYQEKRSEVFRFLELLMKLKTIPLVTEELENPPDLELGHLTEEQIFMLVKIGFHDGQANMSQLASDLFVSKSKATRLVDVLVRKNLVRRNYGERTDRRVVQLEVTPSGQRYLMFVIKDRESFVRKRFGQKITEDEVREVNDVLENVLALLDFHFHT